MKHWVFDLDGTLVDSFSHYFVLLEDIFGAHGVRFAPELRYPALTEQLAVFFEKHLGRQAVEPAFEMLQKGSNQDAAHIRPFRGLWQAMEHLSGQGSRIAVWTNRDLTSAELILKHSGLERFAEICISGSCVIRRKPDPEGLLRIIERFGCEAEEVTMVGDHEHDVSAAKSIGARAIRASWHAYWPMKRCAHADFQFHTIDDFSRWLGAV